MKKINFRVTLNDGSYHSGVFTVFLTKNGYLSISIREIKLDDKDTRDINAITYQVKEILWKEVVEMLWDHMDHLYYVTGIDAHEAPLEEPSEEEPSNEKVVRELP